MRSSIRLLLIDGLMEEEEEQKKDPSPTNFSATCKQKYPSSYYFLETYLLHQATYDAST